MYDPYSEDALSAFRPDAAERVLGMHIGYGVRLGAGILTPHAEAGWLGSRLSNIGGGVDYRFTSGTISLDYDHVPAAEVETDFSAAADNRVTVRARIGF